MKAGEFEPGARVLRGRIDMASSGLPMRDPVFRNLNRDISLPRAWPHLEPNRP